MIDALCTWNNSGADPYRGPVAASVAAAVDRYGMPVQVKAELVRKARMLQPDAVVVITRDGISSADGVATELRDMHYSRGRVCAGPVVRDRWTDKQAETALVYCAQGQCIVVPTICGNVARITWSPAAPPKEPEFRAWADTPGQPQADHLVPVPRLELPTPQAHPWRAAPAPIPEPSSLVLVATGIALLIWKRRK